MSLRANTYSLFFYAVSKVLFKTLRVELINDEQIETLRARHGGVILATWHGRTFVPIVNYANQGFLAMVSTSRDGDYQDKLLYYYGFKTVRGSSSARGAVTAALRLAKSLNKGGILTITPDGPRGPIHVAQPGTIFIAEKSGCPVIPAGVSAYPRKFLSTWDCFMLPLIGARAAIVYGEPMLIPPNLDDAQRSAYSSELSQRIQNLEAEAELLVRARAEKRSAPVY